MLAQSVETVAPTSSYEAPILKHIGLAQDVVLAGFVGPYVDAYEPIYDSGGEFPG